MRTACARAGSYTNSSRRSLKRAPNQEVVIIVYSWPRQILFTRQITSPPLPPSSPAASLSPSPPPTLLCQHLEDFFDKSSAHTSGPPSFLRCQCPLAVRFTEIDSSSLYDVLSSRVNSSETLVLVETGRRTSGDFYLCCFPHVTPRGPRDRGPRVIPGSRTPRAASFRDKGPLDNRVAFQGGRDGAPFGPGTRRRKISARQYRGEQVA